MLFLPYLQADMREVYGQVPYPTVHRLLALRVLAPTRTAKEALFDPLFKYLLHCKLLLGAQHPRQTLLGLDGRMVLVNMMPSEARQQSLPSRLYYGRLLLLLFPLKGLSG